MIIGYLDELEARLRTVEPAPVPFHLTLTGSRDAPEQMWRPVIRSCLELIRDYLDPCVHWQRDRCRHIRPAHGAARGMDTWFDEECRRMHWTPKRYPVESAEWSRFGGYAGHRRNKIMMDNEQPHLVLALIHHRSRGSTGAALYARSQGFAVLQVDEQDAELPRGLRAMM